MNKRHISYVLREYDKKRTKNEQILNDRKFDLYRDIPILSKIDKQIRSNATKSAIIAFEDDINIDKAIEDLRDNHKKLNSQKHQVLSEHGYAKNYLDLIYDCPLCKDYGYVETNLCKCVKNACEILQRREQTSVMSNASQVFSNFNFDLYSKTPDPRYKTSPYDRMTKVYNICKNYADNFNLTSENMIFCGNPGLSKTFLSTAIAKEISSKSFTVVYDTCISILNNFEAKKFSKTTYLENEFSVDEQIARYFSCDLLIIDDLGTELVTPFSTSVLYELINDRIMRKKPMIINTNFIIAELTKKYSPAIGSRLDGDFRFVFFFGDDVRKFFKNN